MYEGITRVCLYARYSSHNQTEQSIEGQVHVCKDFCNRHGFTITDVYIDRATSASHDIEKRTNFLKMISDSGKGKFQAIVVYKLDRFARSRYDSATYKYRLKKNGVSLISATENITDTPEGIILESVLEGMAEFYSAELSQKIRRGMNESAHKHKAVGGVVPLGYKLVDKEYVIDDKTAPWVVEAFRRYADGETVAEICRSFNLRGYRTAKGTEFGKSSFARTFTNERYIGTYQYKDYKAEHAIPAIIDLDTWNRVQMRVKGQKKYTPSTKSKYTYLLSGKLFCGHCGSRMFGNSNSQGYTYYQCSAQKDYHDCNKRCMQRDRLEAVVVKDALALLTDERIDEIADIAVERNRKDVESVYALQGIRHRLNEISVSTVNLTRAIESGQAPEAIVKRLNELEKEKRELLKQEKKESEGIVELDRNKIIYWLSQFKNGNIQNPEFCRQIVDLFVNSVTAWDESDGRIRLVIAYNLTDLKNKTYHLSPDGTSTQSDSVCNAPVLNPNPIVISQFVLHEVSCFL